MTDFEPEEDLPPVAHVTLVYNGPVAPHWEMKTRYGDQKMLDEFWTRVNARLLLLPKHDPQFRRNRERVNRDAERELIICDWDLGDDDAETTSTVVAAPETVAAPVEEAVVADEVVADEPVAIEEAETDLAQVADGVEVADAVDLAEVADGVEVADEVDASAAAEQPAGQG